MELRGLSRDVFMDKYAAPGEKEWCELSKRVSHNIALAEGGNYNKWVDPFFDIINNMDFIPGGRILFGAGRANQSLLNCFSLQFEDNVESLGRGLRDVYLISCQGGGIGINFSKIRPKGDPIQNIPFSAPGVVSEIRKINVIGEEVKGGKNRRTALLAVLNADHPDILDFLHAKLDLSQLNNFNISIGITNEFLKSVQKNKEWRFKFNNKDYNVYSVDKIPFGDKKKEVVQVVALNEEDAIGRARYACKDNAADDFKNARIAKYMAKDLWNRIIENSWRCGDPGLFNLDLVNTHTTVSYFERLDQCNPCGEIPLPPYGSCCLGSINLNNMFNPRTNDVNWSKLSRTIKMAVRFLDDVLSINNYPISLTKEVSSRSRRIGLGVMGLHYLLIKKKYRYGDDKCQEFLERLFMKIRNEAYIASTELAEEKGVFPAFDVEAYLKEEFIKHLPSRVTRRIKKCGIRNATLLTIPPTGTTSIVVGVSSGIEPIFAPVYKRSYRDPEDASVWRSSIVVDKLFKELYENGQDVSHIIGAHDVTPEEHLQVQATVQQFLDSSISKTINVPEKISTKHLSDIVFEFILGLKGVTIYRTNSRGQEPLIPIKIKDDSHMQRLLKKANENGSNSIDTCKSGSCEL